MSELNNSSTTDAIRPNTPAPTDSKGRQELAKQQLRDHNPVKMHNSVNKTALHPGGVQ